MVAGEGAGEVCGEILVGGVRGGGEGADDDGVALGVLGEVGGDGLAESAFGFVAGDGVADGFGDDETYLGCFSGCFCRI